jgi:hypothetical protein
MLSHQDEPTATRVRPGSVPGLGGPSRSFQWIRTMQAWPKQLLVDQLSAGQIMLTDGNNVAEK